MRNFPTFYGNQHISALCPYMCDVTYQWSNILKRVNKKLFIDLLHISFFCVYARLNYRKYIRSDFGLQKCADLFLHIFVYARLKLYRKYIRSDFGMASAAAVPSEFDHAVAYTLSRLGKSELKLKPEQRASIKHVYEGKDMFVWLPTGFGKSICCEALPFVYDFKATTARDHQGLEATASELTARSLVIVISPLISLMVDQVTSLRCRGVLAAIIS